MSLTEIPTCPCCGGSASVEPAGDNEWDLVPDYTDRLKGTWVDCGRCGTTFECYYY